MTTYLCLLRSVYYVVHRAYCRFLCFDGPPPPCLLTIKPHFLCAHNIITTMDGYVVVLLYIHFLCFMVRNFWRLREKLNARTKNIDETNEQTDRQTHQQQSTIATWKWYQTKANNSHLPGLHGRCFPNKNKTETKTIAL